jgi:VWFA-related protein
VLKGVANAAPFKVTVDVGDDNIDRDFRAVAYTTAGPLPPALVTTRRLSELGTLNVNLRTLFVTATRFGGGRASDLAQSDFQIFDNGTPQDIITFGSDELPLTAVLLLDSSQSMQGERFRAVERGARAFIEGMKPLDESMVVLFSDRLIRYVPFTSDHKALASSLANGKTAGGTSVNDHAYLALKLLEGHSGQRVVILFSDGSDVHSVLPAADVLWKARTSQALVYWIQLGKEKAPSFTSSWRDYKANDREYKDLEKAVEESGGRIERIAKLDDLEKAFRGIMQELREQYALGYYASNSKGDGAWHKVSVQVRKGATRVRSREGYFDN